MICNMIWKKCVLSAARGEVSLRIRNAEIELSGGSDGSSLCHIFLPAIQRILLDLRSIQVIGHHDKSRVMELEVRWARDNPLLYPKPVMDRAPVKTDSVKTDLAKIKYELAQKGTLTDVTLIVGGQRFTLHKAILAACPFFLAMFTSKWDEATSAEVPLKTQQSAEAFAQLVRYLYEVGVDQEFLKGADNCIDLLRMVKPWGCDHLGDICAKQLESLINIENFIHIADVADELRHQGLIELCQSWVRANQGFANKINTKNAQIEDLLRWCQLSQIVGAKDLQEHCLATVKSKANLDNFCAIATQAISKKDEDLRKICKTVGKTNRKDMQAEKKGRYQEHWTLFNIITRIDVNDTDYRVPGGDHWADVATRIVPFSAQPKPESSTSAEEPED